MASGVPSEKRWMEMSIYLDVSFEVLHALEKLCEDEEWASIHGRWIELEQATVLFFRLKKVPDDPLIFPRGKWATIQRIEYLIEDFIVAERKEKCGTGQ